MNPNGRHDPNPKDLEGMDREELLAKLEEVAEQMGREMTAMGAHEPDWGPLENAIPRKWCGAFMFMGYEGRIRLYKHGFTRRYLNVDPSGQTYFYKEMTNSYFPVPKSVAIKHVFGGLKEMGLRRTSVYDDAAAARKRKALAEAGWTIVTAKPKGMPRS